MPRIAKREGFDRGVERKVLCDRHQEILRRKALGLSAEDIATDLGISPQVVYHVTRSDLGQERLTELKAGRDIAVQEAMDHITEMMPQAVEVLHKALHGVGEMAGLKASERIKVAETVLDRGGLGKIQKVVGQMDHGLRGRLGIELIKESAGRVLEGSQLDFSNDFDD